MASGSLQTCSGVEAGIEAAIHSMRAIYSENESEGMLLIDASNAFNSLNRNVALHNIGVICPSFHQFMKNSYQSPAKLFVSDINAKASPTVIYSKEGATQGDPAAMAMYALGTRPLIDEVGKNSTGQGFYKQVWYADDASAAGKLKGLKEWWDKVIWLQPLC